MRLSPLFFAPLLVATSLVATAPAMAHDAPLVTPGNALLTISAEGKVTRTPDLDHVFGRGRHHRHHRRRGHDRQRRRDEQGHRRAEAGRRGRPRHSDQQPFAHPVYEDRARPRPDGTTIRDDEPPRITGYQASNTVAIRLRALAKMGAVLDTLVAAGANQINGPDFALDQPEPALDEARIAAMKAARARADLYARAAGLRVVRIVSISENGGYSPQPRMMFAKADAMSAPSTPVAAGELAMTMTVNVQFELAQ